MSWFDDSPVILDEEMKSLDDYGFSYQVNEQAKAQGRLSIDVQYKIDGKTFDLRCEYPASFPYFAVKIFSPNFPPGRHKNPNDHGLCLFASEQSSWSTKDTLAGTISTQVPIIYSVHVNGTDHIDNEAIEGYQISGQIDYEPISTIYVQDIDVSNIGDSGEMQFKLLESKPSQSYIRGVISQISETHTTVDEAIFNKFKTEVRARWVKLSCTPTKISPEDLLEEASTIFPAIQTPNYGNKDIDIVGIAFPEEKTHTDITINWVFIVRRREKKGKRTVRSSVSIVRCDRYTADNLQARTPRVSGLHAKSAVVVGAGALGSQIVWQLARAGINSIKVIDYDIVQAGNLPRWLLGFQYVGWYKTHALGAHLENHYPGIDYSPINMMIGSGQNILHDDTEYDCHDFLKMVLSEADIVIDAAAETNVSNYLSDLCYQLKIPYVWSTATTGAWGGITGRIIPDKTSGRWIDFMNQYASKVIPPPPAEEGPDVQPVGCFSPTFTGIGVDLDHVSLMATRLAITTMLVDSPDANNSYPNFDWDVAVLHLWDETTSLPIAPRWETHKLDANGT